MSVHPIDKNTGHTRGGTSGHTLRHTIAAPKRGHDWTLSHAAGKPVGRGAATGGMGSTSSGPKVPARKPRNPHRKPV